MLQLIVDHRQLVVALQVRNRLEVPLKRNGPADLQPAAMIEKHNACTL